MCTNTLCWLVRTQSATKPQCNVMLVDTNANNYICTNTPCWLVWIQSATKPQCNVMLVDTNANSYICTNTPCWLVWIQSVTKPQCNVMFVDTNANNYMCTNTQCNVMIDCYKLKVMRTPNAKWWLVGTNTKCCEYPMQWKLGWYINKVVRTPNEVWRLIGTKSLAIPIIYRNTFFRTTLTSIIIGTCLINYIYYVLVISMK